MKNTKEFPFEKARRITLAEVRQARRAITKATGQKRRARPGRPPKTNHDKYVAVSIRLNPHALRWAKARARKKHVGYQTLINQILLAKAG